MTFRSSPKRAFATSALLLASALLCVGADAQSTSAQATQNSNASTPSKTTTPATQSHPDVFSPSYVPASNPKRHAIPPPTLIYSVDPQFPANAPKGKFSGIAVVGMMVGTDGKPEQVYIVKSLGPEFDKNAVAAVEQYRFRPALHNGKPVPVKVNVEVDFRRY